MKEKIKNFVEEHKEEIVDGICYGITVGVVAYGVGKIGTLTGYKCGYANGKVDGVYELMSYISKQDQNTIK